MPESLRSRIKRWGFNLFPAFRGTGAWLTYLDDEWREVRLRLPLSWRTRNYVGTIFGGSMYGAVDPIYMIMLIHRLGDGYEVWDRSARIRFLRPAREELYARFELPDRELAAIRAAVKEEGRTDRDYEVELTASDGTVHATVEKTIHVRRARGPETTTGTEG